MAIAKFGGGIVGIRGELGGNIFSAATNGAYVRPWANQPNNRTYPQTVCRYYWSYIMPAWGEIGPIGQYDWKVYAAAHPKTNPLGETYYLTGLQWFTSCNMRLIQWGASTVTEPPTNPAPATVPCIGINYWEQALLEKATVLFTEHSFDGLWMIIDALVRPFGRALSWTSTYYRMKVDNSPSGAENNITLPHLYKFGEPQDGWQMFVRVYTGDDQGLISPPWESSAVYPNET